MRRAAAQQAAATLRRGAQEIAKWDSLLTTVTAEHTFDTVTDELIMAETLTQLRSLQRELLATNWMYEN